MAGMLESLLYPGGGPFSLERAIYGVPAVTPPPAAPAPPAMPSGGSAMPFMDTSGSPSPSGPSAPPPGMLAALFGGSAGFPATMPSGQFPPTAGSAFAAAPPPPPMDVRPPAAPQAPASPLSAMASAAPSGPAESAPVPQTSLLGRLGSLFGDKAGSVLGGIGDTLDSRRNTLMALGAGLAGAPTLGQGLSRGLSGAIPASQLDRQQGFQNATLNWLKAKGMPEDAAKAVVSNPQLLAQIAPQMFGAKQLTATTLGTDVLGHPIPGMMNPVTGEHFDIYGRKLTPGGSAGGPGGSLSGTDPANWAAMAPEERLGTMDPQIQGEIKAIYEGRQTGTGRNVQQLLPLVNQVYPEFTMQDYKAKATMQDDLSKSGNSSMGGILANGKSAFSHLATVSDKLADVGNASHDFPLGGHIATAQNYLGNTLGGSATKGKITAASDALGKYGAESTKFYSGSGGGVEERTAALKNVDPTTTSSEQQAQYLATEKELMLGRLQEKENQIRGTLGDKYLQQHPVMTPELQSTLAKIDGNIAKLRGKAAAPAAGSAQTAPAAPIADKATYDALPKGATYTAPDGSVRTKQ